jgi:hypothetical protein
VNDVMSVARQPTAISAALSCCYGQRYTLEYFHMWHFSVIDCTILKIPRLVCNCTHQRYVHRSNT